MATAIIAIGGEADTLALACAEALTVAGEIIVRDLTRPARPAPDGDSAAAQNGSHKLL